MSCSIEEEQLFFHGFSSTWILAIVPSNPARCFPLQKNSGEKFTLFLVYTTKASLKASSVWGVSETGQRDVKETM